MAPGENPGQSDFGDATCANGNSDFTLFDSGGSAVQNIVVEPIGVVLVDGVPAGNYKLTDNRSSVSGNLTIVAGVVTKVISLQWFFVEDIPDPPVIPEIDLDDDPPPGPPDINAGAGDEDDWDFDFGGPAANADGSDPFTVTDDPEAIARVESVDSFEDMPGVGIGPGTSSTSTTQMFAALGLVLLVLSARFLLRGRRPDSL
jgi:hypothetical protein